MTVKLTKKQTEMMDFISHCEKCVCSIDGVYIETGLHKHFSSGTLRSLFRKGLVKYKDGGTFYRNASFHIIVKTDRIKVIK